MMRNKCQYGFYTCSFIGEQDFCNCCDGGQNYQMKEQKKPVGAPAKPDEEKQTAFTVSCKKKNLETIKPKVKALIKRLDK